MSCFCCLLLTLIVEPLYSKPAAISVFHGIGRLSVLTRCQSLSLPTNALPSVQDESYLEEYRPLVVFSPQTINVPHTGTHVESHHVLAADVALFGRYALIQFLRTLLPCVSRKCLLYSHRLGPLLCLLVCFLSNVYTALEHAYVSLESHHRAIILVHIEVMLFFHRSHDFVALLWRTGQRLLPIRYSVLYNLSRTCRFRYLRSSTTFLRGVRKLCFYVGHRWTNLFSHVFIPTLSSLFSPTIALSSAGHVGGGSSRFPCASVLPYVVSKPSILNDRSCLQYVA